MAATTEKAEKKMITLKKFASALAVAATLVSGAAVAGPTPTVATYVFSDSQIASFPDMTVGTLTIENLANGGTKWTLTGSWNATTYSSAFVNDLEFNTSKALSMSGFHADAGAVASPMSYSASTGVHFATSNAQHGALRMTAGEAVSWTFANTRISDFHILDMHINAINLADPNANSVRFRVAAPVPEADTYAMLLLGLGMLGFTARKRSQKLS